ncbi:hypothetical protein [Ralstonia solanacearum]|uniref:hypothetical protein n=1 Tax=Ralstonia solanacearum TaxID=305 RepID=UPI0018D1DFCE|nr:hypothetical protein [Ralstonia solanacearum]
MAARRTTDQARQGCGGRFVPMLHRVNTFGRRRDALHRIQFGWRPASAEAREQNRPWGTPDAAVLRQIEAIKAATLCGGANQPASTDAGHAAAQP